MTLTQEQPNILGCKDIHTMLQYHICLFAIDSVHREKKKKNCLNNLQAFSSFIHKSSVQTTCDLEAEKNINKSDLHTFVLFFPPT